MNERRNEIWEKELREGRNITVGIKDKGRNDWWEKIKMRWDWWEKELRKGRND